MKKTCWNCRYNRRRSERAIKKCVDCIDEFDAPLKNWKQEIWFIRLINKIKQGE